MRQEVDITGMRFGRLVALRSVGYSKTWALRWECRCDCGRVVVVDKHALMTGHTKSCGCLRREKCKTNLPK